MGFKEWLAQPRLSDEEWRKQMAFVGKGVAIAVSALFIVSTGTDYLDKRAKALGKSGIPVADTEWSRSLLLSKGDGEGTCILGGQYRVTNTGELSFKIEHVLIEIYRSENSGREASWNDKTYPATITAMNNTISQTDPFVVAPIAINEAFGPQNRMEASFFVEFEIPPVLEEDEQFIVIARATGGLPDLRPWWLAPLSWLESGDQDFSKFGARDLQITSNTFRLFQGGCVSATGLDESGKILIETLAWAPS